MVASGVDHAVFVDQAHFAQVLVLFFPTLLVLLGFLERLCEAIVHGLVLLVLLVEHPILGRTSCIRALNPRTEF